MQERSFWSKQAWRLYTLKKRTRFKNYILIINLGELITQKCGQVLPRKPSSSLLTPRSRSSNVNQCLAYWCCIVCRNVQCCIQALSEYIFLVYILISYIFSTSSEQIYPDQHFKFVVQVDVAVPHSVKVFIYAFAFLPFFFFSHT